MKGTTPKQMAVLISVFASIASGVILIFTFDFDRQKFYLTVALSSLSLFLVIYVLCYYLLNRFIFEKIRPIYKTIHDLNISDEKIMLSKHPKLQSPLLWPMHFCN